MLAWLIIIINYIFLIYLSLIVDKTPLVKWVLPALAIVLAATLVYKAIDKKPKADDAGLLPVFLVIMAAWTVMGLYWIALVDGLLYLLALAASRRLIVYLSTDSLLYPSIPKQRVSWGELNNVILKDGILTIDFRNNKLSQQEIDERLSPVDEKEFNEFCKAQLSK